MTTQANTTAKNLPAYNVLLPEERPADPVLAARLGKTLAANSTDVIWHRAGVVFKTKSDNLAIFIGDKDDKAQRKFLAVFSSRHGQSADASRLPVADVFERNADDDIDFREKAGVLFLNRDEASFTFVLDADDEKVRYQLMPSRRQDKPATPPTQPTRSTVRRDNRASAA
jgi:hypothetical protein